MPGSSGKKRVRGPQGTRAVRPSALPPPEAIISIEEFTSPKTKKTYRVIETNELDAYDKIKKSRSRKRAVRAKKKRG